MVKFDRVYPRLETSETTASLLSDVEIRDSIIAKVQAGKSWKVATAETSSAATGAGTRPVIRVAEIAKQLREDVVALRALNPLEYATAVEFLAAMNTAASVLPVATWVQHLQDAYEIPDGTADARFAALKAKLTPEV